MKHIKPFNEALDENFREELQDFCETNLAYLLDEGIEVNVILGEHGNTNLTDFERYLIRIMIKEDKSWNEIKDQMIPFLTRLSRKYEIGLRTPSSRTDLLAPAKAAGLSSLALNAIMEDDIRFIYFGEDSLTPKVMNDKVNNMINDETSNWSGYRGEIKLHEIRLYICGYKQENKSVLTKSKIIL
jgi:hypothetical protein